VSRSDFDRALAELCAGLLRAAVVAAESAPAEGIAVAVEPPLSAMSHEQWVRATRLWLDHGKHFADAAEARDCPACGAPPGPRLFTSYDGHGFHACSRCETWFVPRRIDWALFERFFAECPEAAALAAETNRHRAGTQANADAARFGGYFADLAPLLREGRRRYLDIGCAVGHSLAAAEAAGFEAHGVEADTDARAVAGARHAVVATMDALPPGRYELVSLWETVEHLADPLAMLEACRDRLADDGIVAFTLPNLDAVSARLLREECGFVYGGFNHPGHVNLFSRASFAALLERAGLALVGTRGLFSDGLNALVARLFRTRREVHASEPVELPQHLVAVLNAIGPAIALLAAASGHAPMTFCVACRAEAASRVGSAGKAWEAEQRAAIAVEARGHLTHITDYEARVVELEAHVAELEARAAALAALVKKVRWRPWVRL
jgi:SAM-dependent methyltransferase